MHDLTVPIHRYHLIFVMEIFIFVLQQIILAYQSTVFVLYNAEATLGFFEIVVVCFGILKDFNLRKHALSRAARSSHEGDENLPSS